MSTEWKDILENSGVATIGQTLIRLAQAAEAIHRSRVAELLTDGSTGPASSDAVDGSIAIPNVQPQRAARMEVGS